MGSAKGSNVDFRTATRKIDLSSGVIFAMTCEHFAFHSRLLLQITRLFDGSFLEFI